MSRSIREKVVTILRQSTLRIEGSKNTYDIGELLNQGKRIQIDLGQLSSQDRQATWKLLTEGHTLEHELLCPILFPNSKDQFGCFHEGYQENWMDWAEYLTQFLLNLVEKRYWKTKSEDIHLYRSSSDPLLITIEFPQQDNSIEFTSDYNCISASLKNVPNFGSETQESPQSAIYAKNKQSYHKDTKKREALQTSIVMLYGTLCAYLIWFACYNSICRSILFHLFSWAKIGLFGLIHPIAIIFSAVLLTSSLFSSVTYKNYFFQKFVSLRPIIGTIFTPLISILSFHFLSQVSIILAPHFVLFFVIASSVVNVMLIYKHTSTRTKLNKAIQCDMNDHENAVAVSRKKDLSNPADQPDKPRRASIFSLQTSVPESPETPKSGSSIKHP